MADDTDFWLNRIAATSLITPSQYGGPASGGSSGRSGGGMVYVGPVTRTVTRQVAQPSPMLTPSRYGGPTRTTTQTQLVNADGMDDEQIVRGYVYRWYGTQGYDAYVRRLVSLGLIQESDRNDIELLDSIWQKAVDLSMRLYAAGKKVTPWTALELLGRSGYTGGRGGGFTGTRSRSDAAIVLTNPTAAKNLINDVLSQHLGRRATEEEVRTLTAMLNAAERANPVTTTTTETWRDGEVVSTSTTRSGGVDGAQVIADDVMERPEYGAYQAASTYFEALLGALSSPV